MPTAPPPLSAGPMPRRHIGLLIFDGVDELDVVGPWEVFSHWSLQHPEDGWSVSCISRDGAPIVSDKGLAIGAHHSFSTMPSLDVLTYPGGRGTRSLMRDPDHLAWVRGQRAAVRLMTSVCTGALVYASAGLLTGRPATTHWESLDLLTQLDPSIATRPDDRFVDDGDVITSAGVSAGIDMALHVVGRLAGIARAEEVRCEIQYDATRPPGDRDVR